MCIFRSISRSLSFENNPLGLFESELCFLDEVREVRLVEGEEAVFGGFIGGLRRRFAQRLDQVIESLHTLYVIGLAPSTYIENAREVGHVTRPKGHADKTIEYRDALVGNPKRQRKNSRLVAQNVEHRFPVLPAQLLNPKSELVTSQPTRRAAATSGRLRILYEASRT